MPEPTLYLFDGYNLLHAGGFEDRGRLRDELASFVALRGARGVLVFDGSGPDEGYGSLEVRFARNADALLERLAAENRGRERVCLITSDASVLGTSGQEVTKMSSRLFLRDLSATEHREGARSPVGERLDEETRRRLEELRRGGGKDRDL